MFNSFSEIPSSPHLVILGAGASRATLPAGDLNGQCIPVMNDLSESVGLAPYFEEEKVKNFEESYAELKDESIIKIINEKINDYFSSLELPEQPTSMIIYFIL